MLRRPPTPPGQGSNLPGALRPAPGRQPAAPPTGRQPPPPPTGPQEWTTPPGDQDGRPADPRARRSGRAEPYRREPYEPAAYHPDPYDADPYGEAPPPRSGDGRGRGRRDRGYRDSGYPDDGYPDHGYPDDGYGRRGSGYADDVRDDRGRESRTYRDRDDWDGDRDDAGYRRDAGRRDRDRSGYPRDDTDGPDPPDLPDRRPSGPDPRAHRTGSDRRDDRPRPTSQLPPYSEPTLGQPEEPEPPPVPRGLGGRSPRKLTVTRVAALRSRELTHRGMEKFHGAVTADGADRSGLGHLTYAVMANYAVDAALAVALANTLFFAAAKADSTGKVLLYLLLTVAPFAIIAPFIGPLLDRVQNGRRIALSLSSFGRAVLAVVMALKFDSWVIYPCALGMLVLSKSFGVLKAALTPRVLPEQITLVKTNSRLTVFGMIAGGVSGGIAAGIAALTNSAGALGFTAAVAVVGGWLCLRIPAWVESTEGEVPVEQRQRTHRHRVLPRPVAGALWTNATIRVETGFLALFIAFVIKSRYQPSSVVAAPGAPAPPPTDHEGLMQLLLLGAVGAAAGLGGFLGNALGARLPLRAPQTVALVCLGTVIAAVLLAFLMPGLITAGAVALVGSTASSLAKVCLDSTIQQNLPEVSRASAFGRSESVLQLSWVFGGVIGLLIGGVWALSGDTVFMVGFGIVGLLLLAGGAQCIALRMGRSLLPAVSLRALLHRPPKHDTAPVPRMAGPAGYRSTNAAGYGGSGAGGNGAPASGGTPAAGQAPQSRRQQAGGSGRRATRKAGRPR